MAPVDICDVIVAPFCPRHLRNGPSGQLTHRPFSPLSTHESRVLFGGTVYTLSASCVIPLHFLLCTCLSVCLSVCLYVCLCVCMSACLYTCLSGCLCVCLSGCQSASLALIRLKSIHQENTLNAIMVELT